MRCSLALLICGAIACGAMPGHDVQPNGGGSGSGSGSAKPAGGPGDVSFDVPPIEIKGVVFEPQAIYSPAMMLIEAKKKVTLEKQRDVVAKTKDAVQREAQAAVLATMLYEKSKPEKTDADRNKWYAEALQVLRDAAEVSGWDKTDDITLRLIGRYTLLLNDYAGAEKAWSALVQRFPKEKDVADSRGWWAYSLLMQYKNDEAAQVLSSDQPSEKQPELTYVIAWTRFRKGDEAGAFQAILVASKGWKDLPGREALDRDVFLFAGRGVAMQDAVTALTPGFGANPDQLFDLYLKLGFEAYQYAGRWADGIAALDKVVPMIDSLKASKLAEAKKVAAKHPDDAKKLEDDAKKLDALAPKLRYTQASYALRLDDPATVAKYGKALIDSLTSCGDACDEEKKSLVEAAVSLPRLLYVLYATAHDDRYYQPAHDLYLAVMPLVSANKELEKSALEESTNLEGFHKAMKPTDGTHAKDQISRLLDLHDQEVQACYELALAANPKVGGTLVVHIESDQTGVIKGVSTEPKAGMADLALVAGCTADHVKQWRLPKIANGNGPHTTRIKMTYSLSPRVRAGAGGGENKTEANGGTPPAPPSKK